MRSLSALDPHLQFTQHGLWDLLTPRADAAFLLSQVRSIYRLNSVTSFPQQHLPARVLKDLIEVDEWNSVFKFAFVRNPWDLLVSTYHFLKALFAADPHRAAIDPDQAELIRRSPSFDDFVHLYPFARSDMTAMIANKQGEILVDFVGRYESLADDFGAVARRIGVDATLVHSNSSTHDNYREYYTAATRDIVTRHFKRDIERFEYEF